MLNIKNPSKAAEDIGRRQLGELLRVAGIPVISDTDQLIGTNATITLKIRKQEGYRDSNSVTRYEPIAAAGSMPMPMPSVPPRPQMPAPQKPALAPAQQKAAGAPPWAVKKPEVPQAVPEIPQNTLNDTPF